VRGFALEFSARTKICIPLPDRRLQAWIDASAGRASSASSMAR
jgi:hypothetical protein